MALDVETLQRLTNSTPEEAWRVIIDKAVEITAKPLTVANAPSEVTKRDREIGALDHFLSSSGWDLWQAFGSTVERTSDRLMRWWAQSATSFTVRMLSLDLIIWQPRIGSKRV